MEQPVSRKVHGSFGKLPVECPRRYQRRSFLTQPGENLLLSVLKFSFLITLNHIGDQTGEHDMSAIQHQGWSIWVFGDSDRWAFRCSDEQATETLSDDEYYETPIIALTQAKLFVERAQNISSIGALLDSWQESGKLSSSECNKMRDLLRNLV